MGVNSRVELAQVTAIMRARILERLMLDGVTIEDPSSTYVDWGVGSAVTLCCAPRPC